MVAAPARVLAKHPKSIELFTGAGGLALGIARAGFQHLALVEYNRDACASLRLNLPHVSAEPPELFEGDVKSVDFAPYAGDVDLLAAGAPCQPFSIGGKHRAHADQRNLFPEVFRAVREIAPKLVLIENVKGLLRHSFAPYVEFIELQLASPLVLPKRSEARSDPDSWQEHLPMLRKTRGASDAKRGELRYRVSKRLLNAADFGVPQTRERVFFVAVREDLEFEWAGAVPTHSRAALLHDQWATGEYWERHGVQPRRRPKMPREIGELASELRLNDERKQALAWRTVRDALVGLPEPRDRAESPGWLNHIGQPGARTYAGHTGSPLDAPAKTLKAGGHGVPGGENMLRRVDGSVRYFTVREAARLQTFPDKYHVQGAWGEAMRQLGNAVPVRLASAVAESLLPLLQPRSLRRPTLGLMSR